MAWLAHVKRQPGRGSRPGQSETPYAPTSIGCSLLHRSDRLYLTFYWCVKTQPIDGPCVKMQRIASVHDKTGHPTIGCSLLHRGVGVYLTFYWCVKTQPIGRPCVKMQRFASVHDKTGHPAIGCSLLHRGAVALLNGLLVRQDAPYGQAVRQDAAYRKRPRQRRATRP